MKLTLKRRSLPKNYIFFEGATFVAASKSKLFPSEVLIVSNISFFKPYRSFNARLNSAEKQFKAEVTNQVFCNQVAFLASFQKLRSLIPKNKVRIVRWHAWFEFKRLQSLKQKIKLLSNMHRRPFTRSLKTMRSSQKSDVYCGCLVF